MFAEIYPDNNDEWQFRTVAGNGRIISASTEGYDAIASCRNALAISSPQLTDVREFSENPRFKNTRRKKNYKQLKTN